jgi:peptide/nickel transport system permease protein
MKASVCWLVLLAFVSLLTPLLPIPDTSQQDLAHEYAAPSREHPLGLGENGGDVLSNLLWGGRNTLAIALSSVLVSAFIGLLLGSMAGYLRGSFDTVLMRIIDLLYSFPGILLVVALAAFLGPSLRNVFIALTVTSWASYARLVRALCLSLRERDFVLAARAMGCSMPRILMRHLWPNLSGPLMVQMTFGLRSAIMAESSLSFLGLGAPPGTPSWGLLLNQGREILTTSTHLVWAPGLALALSLLALSLLGDGLRDKWDPRARVWI